ncbi:PbsX family transcriptional regulator [Bacillus licheniformis]|nr:PbsX family transcriptional regulator [Bacillus licheniformis]
MNKKVIGAKLMKLRGDKTRSLVANELEISESTLAMYESGHRTPRDEIKVRIANYYKKTVQEIFLKINFTNCTVNPTQRRRLTMNQKKLDQLTDLLNGMTQSEWNRVKQHVDMLYSSKAAKVEFDESELLEINLKREFRIS